MPSPLSPSPVPGPARAPFRGLAKAGEAAGLLGAGREGCPYDDDDGRSVPWLDGWWQGRRARERSAVRRARDERRGRPARVTKRKEPPPRPDVVGSCRVCGAPIPWDEAKSVPQNLGSHYCGEAHELEWRRRTRARRTERERAEVAAGTRERRPGGPRGEAPDGCEAEAARLNAHWAELGYDIKAEVVDDPVVGPDGRRRRVRRIRSRLVAGVPEGASWEEVEARIRALDRTRLAGRAA